MNSKNNRSWSSCEWFGFNVRGEPIVNSPEDAFRRFMNTEMDVLVIENFIYLKKEQKIKIIKDEFKKD